MRKITFSLFLFFFTFFLFAQDDNIEWNYGDAQDVKVTPDEDVVWVYDASQKKEVVEDSGLFRVPDRTFEIGFVNFVMGFSNDFISTSEFFRDKVKINIDNLSDGFNINTHLFLNPVYFSYNKNNNWGFGFSTGLSMEGILGLDGNMLTFHESDAAKSDIGAALFADVNIHSFFTYEKFKIKIKPAVYYPILYARPDNFSYTFKNKKTNGIDETYFNIMLDMRIYTAYQAEGDFDIFKILKNYGNFTSRPGVDISLGAEYPLSETLGLLDIEEYLYFDVGVDFINIPIYPSDMEDYMRMIMNVGSDKPIDFFNGMFGESPEDINNEEMDETNFYNYQLDDYTKGRRNVFRPFKMLISANWHPLDKPSLEDSDEPLKIKREWLTIIPTIGFAVNPLYFQPFSFEGGIKARLNLSNLFIAAIGIGYYDRLWKNSFDIAFNLLLYEIDLGVSVQSPGFIKSWTGGGFSVSFGIKFGW